MQEGTRTERNGITFFWTTITEISHKTTLMLMIMWKICLLFPRLNGVLPTSRSSVAPSSSLMIYDCHIFISYFIAWRVPYHSKIIGENCSICKVSSPRHWKPLFCHAIYISRTRCTIYILPLYKTWWSKSLSLEKWILYELS